MDVDHPVLGAVRQVGLPFRLSATPATIRTAPPLLGEHADEILSELGYGPADVETLRQPRGDLTVPARPMITYPTQRLLGVIDDPARARDAAEALAAAGLRPDAIDVLAGSDGRAQLAALGSRPNVLSRMVRAVQFLSMDQLPDFLVYERAIDDGRAVIAVRVPDRGRLDVDPTRPRAVRRPLPELLRAAVDRGDLALARRGARDPRPAPAIDAVRAATRSARAGPGRRRNTSPS